LTDHTDDKPTAATPVEDQRKHERHEKTAFVWYQIIAGLPGEEGRQGLCYSVDVSQGGIGMTVANEIPQGTLLMVEAVVGPHTVPAVCRSAHCRGDDSGLFKVGLQFVAVPPDARRLLSSHFK
jgi:hypothetical protein